MALDDDAGQCGFRGLRFSSVGRVVLRLAFLSGIAGGSSMVVVAATLMPHVPVARKGLAGGAIFGPPHDGFPADRLGARRTLRIVLGAQLAAVPSMVNTGDHVILGLLTVVTHMLPGFVIDG